jgi:hypothetical protein
MDDDTTIVCRREPTLDELMAQVREKPTLPKYRAGRLCHFRFLVSQRLR